MPERKHREIPVWFGVFLMIVITIVVASIVYVNVTGMISLDVSYQDGFQFYVNNTTILEIVALVIILTFITIWIFLRNKSKKKQN